MGHWQPRGVDGNGLLARLATKLVKFINMPQCAEERDILLLIAALIGLAAFLRYLFGG